MSVWVLRIYRVRKRLPLWQQLLEVLPRAIDSSDAFGAKISECPLPTLLPTYSAMDHDLGHECDRKEQTECQGGSCESTIQDVPEDQSCDRSEKGGRPNRAQAQRTRARSLMC